MKIIKEDKQKYVKTDEQITYRATRGTTSNCVSNEGYEYLVDGTDGKKMVL